MAEIRVNNAPPDLITGLEKMMLEFREQTIAKTIVKMIPRYFELKKIIEEQNKDIEELSYELRQKKMKESSLHQSFSEHTLFLINNTKALQNLAKEAAKKEIQFGTKRNTRKRAGVKKSKILSTKK